MNEPTERQWADGIKDALAAAEAWQERAEAAEAALSGLRTACNEVLTNGEWTLEGDDWLISKDVHGLVQDELRAAPNAPDEATREGACPPEQPKVRYCPGGCQIRTADGRLECRAPDCPFRPFRQEEAGEPTYSDAVPQEERYDPTSPTRYRPIKTKPPQPGFALRFHSAMPGWCKVDGLTVRPVPECEGGGYKIPIEQGRLFIEGMKAERLRAALKFARPLVEKWCHYQGDTEALFAQYLGPIDAALEGKNET